MSVRIAEFSKRFVCFRLGFTSANRRENIAKCTLSEKRERFNEIFTENVAKELEAGGHFSYRYGCEFEETRNGTTYEAWIY